MKYFRRSSQLACLTAVCAVAVTAQLHASPELDRAAAPINDGVPEVAVVRLRELLKHQLSDADRRTAMTRLAEALIAADQPAEAEQILAVAEVSSALEKIYLQAQAAAALGHWSAALAFYQQCATQADSPFRDEAVVGHAEALRGLGRVDEAVKALEALPADSRYAVRARLRIVELLLQKGDVAAAAPLLKSIKPKVLAERKQRRFLDGCLEARRGNPKRAIELLTSILKAPQGATRPVIVATLFALADANLQAGSPGSGDDRLEEFIEHYPTDSALPAVFAKLDEVYAAQPKQSRHELSRWSNDAQQPRRGLALWYLARAESRLGQRDLAIAAFQQLRGSRPSLPIFAEALLEEAQLELNVERPDEAVATLQAAHALNPAPSVLTRIEFLNGRAEYAAKHFNPAARTFERIASGRSPLVADAIHNASLAWLQEDDRSRFAADSQHAEQSSRGELMLAQGLAEAARGDANAATTLQNFARDFPHHERAAEASLALAEIAFHAAPPRLDEARQALTAATSSKPADAVAERIEYLAIWLADADAGNRDEKVITLANEFLQKRATSPLVSEVRLKLAETYYGRQDFASAQTQFEILAQRNPESPEAEKAQYFAAQSAMQSMGEASLERALALFGQVAKRGGELKWPARNQQAVIERKLGQPREASMLYDEVTRGDAPPAEKREALCGKADIFYELGGSDPESYRRAIELYDQLAAQKDVPAHWRNEALFKKGVCLEKLQARPDALATFYTIVEDDYHSQKNREYFWFYKAGFNAARLLEEDAQWAQAAAVYEKLTFAGGDRSEEAKSRLNRLRLEHFLWDQ